MSASPGSLLLAAWLGASTLFATVVAPAAFAVLPSRSLAGALVGRVLPTVYTAGIVVAVAAMVLDRRGSGRAPRARRAALVVMAVACAIAQLVVAPRIERLRAEDGGGDILTQEDARRAAFGRLHTASAVCLLLAMLGAGTTIVLGALPARARRTQAGEPVTAPP